MKILVLADPHYYDPSLGTGGEAIEEYLKDDPKMLRDNKPIWDACFSMMADEDATFLLVPGDITKDGEKINHQKGAEYFARLEKAGIKVLVIPGNHDIYNPHAASYNGNTVTPVSSISPDEFLEIYNAFGYSSALYRDPHSLSYIHELEDNYWLLAMDSCIFETGLKKPNVCGRFEQTTLDWIKDTLKIAQEQGKTVIGMVHHSLLEHFQNLRTVFPDFILENWQQVSAELAASGLKIVFSGHHHAQSVTKWQSPETDDFMVDIQTASIISYPCTYRYVDIKKSGAGHTMTVKTRQVKNVDFDYGGRSFLEYAMDFIREGFLEVSKRTLLTKYGQNEETARFLAPYAADAMLAFVAGTHEVPGAKTALGFAAKLLESGDPIQARFGGIIHSMLTSSPEPNNEVIINLVTGECE